MLFLKSFSLKHNSYNLINHTGLDQYGLYFPIASLWSVSSSQTKANVLQEGISGVWKVVQCELRFAFYLSIHFFWFYSFSLLLFADVDKIAHSYITFSFPLFLDMQAEKKVTRGNGGVDICICVTDQNVDGHVDWFANCHSLFVIHQQCQETFFMKGTVLEIAFNGLILNMHCVQWISNENYQHV